MKAQLFTADAVAASAVIIMAIGLALFVHQIMLEEIDYSYSSSRLDRAAQALISQVMNNVSQNSVIDENTAKALFSKDYAQLSQMFGISYNFSISIIDAHTRKTKSVDSVQLSAGLSFKNPTRLSTAERFAVLGGDYVVVRVRVFE